MQFWVWSALLALLPLLAGCFSGQPAAKGPPMPEGANIVYVVNEGDSTVSVIEGSTRSVIATIPVGKRPHYVALEPSGKRAYVTDGDSNSITVIDTATNQAIARIEGLGGDPQQIVVHPEGKLAYVTCYDSSTVCVIDLVAGRVSATIPVGESPQSIAIAPKGDKVYVANLHDPEAMVIDTAANKVIATFRVGEGACGIAISPDGSRLYLGGHGAGMWMGKGEMNRDVRVIDARTFKLLSFIRCGTMPIAVKTSNDGRLVYVASHGSGELHVIDSSSNQASPMKVGTDCRDVVGSRDGRRSSLVHAMKAR